MAANGHDDRPGRLTPARLFSLEKRTVLLTGAAGGIGSALAHGFAAAGARLLLTDVAEEPTETLAASLRDAGAQAHGLACDLGDADAPAVLVDAACDAFGTIDVLANVAGLNRRQPFLEVDRDSFDRVVDVDLRAPYFLAQAVAQRMIEHEHGGAIVNVGSITVRFGLEHVSAYGAAKAGLAQLTRTLAVELAGAGIRVNTVCPGFVDTPLAAPLWEDPGTRAWLLDRIPLARPSRPDELVGACLLLASDAGSYITGEEIYVDGGFLAGGRLFSSTRERGGPT